MNPFKKINEYFKDHAEAFVSYENQGIFIFVCWVLSVLVVWRFLVGFGAYLIFGMIHLVIAPCFLGVIFCELWKQFKFNKFDLIVSSFLGSVGCSLYLVGIPGRSFGVLSTFFIYVDSSGYSLRGLPYWWRVIDPLNFIEVNWRSDISSSPFYLQLLMIVGMSVVFPMVLWWLIDSEIEKMEKDQKQEELKEQARLCEIEREKLEEQRRKEWEEEIRREQELGLIEAKKRDEKKRQSQEGSAWDSGFLE